MIYWCICGTYTGKLLFGIYCPLCQQRIIATESRPSGEVTLDEGIITIQYNEDYFPYNLMPESEEQEFLDAIDDAERKHQAFEIALEQRKQMMKNIGAWSGD